ncbi:MAG: DUF116 domain-containing protein [Candidatus Zixiibacteriota bacterium]|nr:MAG: DUF116 domain-containing protein [candidate division Zixibacteria bacterium]
MEQPKAHVRITDRKLGDEWADWDGKQKTESCETDYRIFLGIAVISTIVLIMLSALFLWLIYPRLASMGTLVADLFSVIFLAFCGILLAWLILFVLSAVIRWPVTRLIAVPKLVNRLLSLVTMVGRIFGISRDRLTNSFLKIHNMIIGAKPSHTVPEKLLLLLPRCLTRDNFWTFRQLRDRYGFRMATVGGGAEARQKIREARPDIIIAIACERDLMSGFKEVNVHTPVIGFPNQRPEGPCKNTCVDLNEIEQAIKNRLHL